VSGTPIITIDGPGGSGKGTVARLVARQLNWHLLDSGALYRLVGLAADRRQLDPADAAAHAEVARTLNVRFGADGDAEEQIFLDGTDVTAEIRTEAGGELASRVAVIPEVRTALLGRQHAFAEPPGLVADGRDMGTVVFPTAQLKIYLTASAAERAQRRHKQLKAKGLGGSLAALSRDIAERDQRDMSRTIAPLVPADDAVLIDSTLMTIDAVVRQVLQLAMQRFAAVSDASSSQK
jgi:cytidylate kinase